MKNTKSLLLATLLLALASGNIANAATNDDAEEMKSAAVAESDSEAESIIDNSDSETLFAVVKRRYGKWSMFLAGVQSISPLDQQDLGRQENSPAVAESVNKSKLLKK